MNRTLAVVLLSAATLLAFVPVVNNGYVEYDDNTYVSENPHIQQGVNTGTLRWALASFYAANWHPVTWLSHMIDWQVYGPKPAGHHVTSLLIHLASVLVLFLALERMTGAAGRSAFVAALFAVHPLHVESVAWLAERKDVLCALFWFLAIGAYARRNEQPRLAPPAVVAFAVLALSSKPMAVTLPLTLLLLDFWPLGSGRSRTALVAIREKTSLFALSATSAGLTVMAQHAGRTISTLAERPLDQRLGNAAVAYVAYLVKTVWPMRLAAFYPHPGATIPTWKILGAVALITVASALALRLRRTRPYLLFGWLWYLVTLLPVIGLVQIGAQGMADRYTYIPLVGIFVVISWGGVDAIESLAVRVSPRGRRHIAMTTALVCMLILIGVTRFQVRFWKDQETLFTRAIAVTEGNYIAHAELGTLRARQGRLDEADEQFREVLRMRPNLASGHMNLGANLFQLGKADEAFVELRVALRLDPSDPRIQSNLGRFLSLQGSLDEARRHFEEAIRLDPNFTDGFVGLGHVLARLGRYDEACVQFTEAIRLDPRNAHFHFYLAAGAFFRADYAKAWREARLARAYGFEPPPEFISALSAKMPEPN